SGNPSGNPTGNGTAPQPAPTSPHSSPRKWVPGSGRTSRRAAPLGAVLTAGSPTAGYPRHGNDAGNNIGKHPGNTA
ncbi:MAG: hypothetical protein ACXVCX_21075, partial [Ktedonobacterales bacterium]